MQSGFLCPDSVIQRFKCDQTNQHHYIPQCYLHGFAPRKQKKRQRHEHTVEGADVGRKFTTAPRNVAGQRDVNRVAGDGLNSDVLESDLPTCLPLA